MISLAQVSGMTASDFVVAFGDVAEHSPWVAEGAFAFRPYDSVDALIAAFEGVLTAATPTQKLALVRAHPDLATKAKLTDDSNREQHGAGLSVLSAEEFARFSELNARYKMRFGFPFIFAVKGATKHQILSSFEERIDNSVDAEFAMALTQVMRIFRFRLEDRVSP